MPVKLGKLARYFGKLEFEKVSEWDTMEEYDNVER